MEAKEFNRLLKDVKWNEKAIENLYAFYYPRAVKHFSAKYGLMLAEDATQEFFLHLLKICDKQEYVKSPTGWIYTCIENIIKRKIQFESKYFYMAETATFIETVESNENDIYADELLKDLNPLEQKIIYLIHWEGYSRKEIADIVHLTPANVRQIYSRSLKKIKKFLECHIML